MSSAMQPMRNSPGGMGTNSRLAGGLWEAIGATQISKLTMVLAPKRHATGHQEFVLLATRGIIVESARFAHRNPCVFSLHFSASLPCYSRRPYRSRLLTSTHRFRNLSPP